MRKCLLAILIAVFAALTLAGCNTTTQPPSETVTPSPLPTQPPALPSALDATTDPAIWEAVHGKFSREGASQDNNAVLAMKYLSNYCVLFEFTLTERSESEDEAHDTIVYGVMIVDEKGVGLYETHPGAASFSINFVISEDGKRVSVTHSGELSISPDGEYSFTDTNLEVSDLSANAILEHLPSAATSLNSNLGAYTIHYPEALVADWFYPVEVTFDDSNVVLAKFLIAKDLSAVFRVDDDIDPVLIFGSAQPMMDAQMNDWQTDNEINSVEDESTGSPLLETLPIVSVGLEDGVELKVGLSSLLNASLPWELPYSITAQSSDKTVATVDTNGTVTAIAPGEATISGTITVEDGVKEFSIEIFVANEVFEEEVTELPG